MSMYLFLTGNLILGLDRVKWDIDVHCASLNITS